MMSEVIPCVGEATDIIGTKRLILPPNIRAHLENSTVRCHRSTTTVVVEIYSNKNSTTLSVSIADGAEQ